MTQYSTAEQQSIGMRCPAHLRPTTALHCSMQGASGQLWVVALKHEGPSTTHTMHVRAELNERPTDS